MKRITLALALALAVVMPAAEADIFGNLRKQLDHSANHIKNRRPRLPRPDDSLSSFPRTETDYRYLFRIINETGKPIHYTIIHPGGLENNTVGRNMWRQHIVRSGGTRVYYWDGFKQMSMEIGGDSLSLRDSRYISKRVFVRQLNRIRLIRVPKKKKNRSYLGAKQ